MIVDHRQIEYFKKVANSQYLPMLLTDYGADKRDIIVSLTDAIANIYKFLEYNSFRTVTIYKALDSTVSLKTLTRDFLVVRSFDNLGPVKGEHICIELTANGELNYVRSEIEISTIRQTAIAYKFDKSNETETIFGKNDDFTLMPIPDADSYFAIQTYKELDVALEDYATKVARHSECAHLKSAWFDNSRIFFKQKPEHILRDSLTSFLKMRLRQTEVRPEQIVDKSHPVDIKITWNLANHLALVEIKWLGKSLQQLGRAFKQIYTRKRALEGADQLANYLNENLRQAPVKITKGYLVIFDARRWGGNSRTTTITSANGLRYANEIITFNPDYTLTRTDFAKPIVFFLEPITNG